MTRKPRFTCVTAPAFLASYFVNGDASGLTDEEERQADEFLAAEGVTILSADEDSGEEFARFPHPWNVYGQTLQYTAQVIE